MYLFSLWATIFNKVIVIVITAYVKLGAGISLGARVTYLQVAPDLVKNASEY